MSGIDIQNLQRLGLTNQPGQFSQATYDPFMAIAAMQRPTVQPVTNPVFGGIIPMNFGVPTRYNPYGVQQYTYDGPMYVAGSSYRPPPPPPAPVQVLPEPVAPLPIAPVTPDVPYAPPTVMYEGPTYTPGQTVRANEAAAAAAAAATPPPEVVQQQYQQQVTQSLGYNPYATSGGEVYAGPFVVPSEPVESLDQYYIQTLGYNPMSQSGGGA